MTGAGWLAACTVGDHASGCCQVPEDGDQGQGARAAAAAQVRAGLPQHAPLNAIMGAHHQQMPRPHPAQQKLILAPDWKAAKCKDAPKEHAAIYMHNSVGKHSRVSPTSTRPSAASTSPSCRPLLRRGRGRLLYHQVEQVPIADWCPIRR